MKGGYDLVYAASIIHWMDADIACPKVIRLLKSGGTFAMLHYNVTPAWGDELYDAIEAGFPAIHRAKEIEWAKKTIETFCTPRQLS